MRKLKQDETRIMPLSSKICELSSTEQMEVYKAAYDNLSEADQKTILYMIGQLQLLRNMGTLSSYELLFKLGDFLKWHAEPQN